MARERHVATLTTTMIARFAGPPGHDIANPPRPGGGVLEGGGQRLTRDAEGASRLTPNRSAASAGDRYGGAFSTKIVNIVVIVGD
jgi:hypothetical protein